MTPEGGTQAAERVPGRLRVAVAVDGSTVPAAVARTIDLVAAAQVDLVQIALHSPTAKRSPGGRLAAIVDRLDRAAFRYDPDAFRPVDLGRSYADRLVSRTSRSSDPGGPAIDLVLDLTSTGLSGDMSRDARLGTWSLRYGERRLPMSPTTFASEFASGSSIAIAELVAKSDPPAAAPVAPPGDARVLYQSVGSVDRHSPARTRNAAAWKAAEFPSRVLSNWPAGDRAMLPDLLPPRPAGVGQPSFWVVLGVAGLILARAVREALRRTVERPGWFVAIRVGRSDAATTRPTDLNGFHPMAAPSGRFYADPFVVRTSTGAQLFVEDAPTAGGPARITTIALDEAGRQASAPRIVVDRPTHLSYPLVFKDADDWYMLPETSGTRTIELFRARRFPDDWEPFAALLQDISALDPTIVHHADRYWLFAAVAPFGASPSDELCVFWSDTIVGPWHPHLRNPVVSDARRARPAGWILLDGDGSLVRPSQDCTGGYGRRIVLNRIEILSPDEYREVPIGSIEPRGLAGVLRTHTYTSAGAFEALDGLRYERRFRFARRRP